MGEPILEDERMPSDIPDLAASCGPTPVPEVGPETALPLKSVAGESRPSVSPAFGAVRNRRSDDAPTISVAELIARQNRLRAPRS
jgi:hypothetical protein